VNEGFRQGGRGVIRGIIRTESGSSSRTTASDDKPLNEGVDDKPYMKVGTEPRGGGIQVPYKSESEKKRALAQGGVAKKKRGRCGQCIRQERKKSGFGALRGKREGGCAHLARGEDHSSGQETRDCAQQELGQTKTNN